MILALGCVLAAATAAGVLRRPVDGSRRLHDGVGHRLVGRTPSGRAPASDGAGRDAGRMGGNPAPSDRDRSGSSVGQRSATWSGRPSVTRSGRWSAPIVVRVLGPLAGAALAVAGLGLTGLLLGLVAGLLLPGLIARAEPATVGRTRRELLADLPLAVELVAAAMAVGAEPATALGLVGGALSGELGDRFVVTARALRLGAEPLTAWEPALERGGEPLQPLAEAFAAARTDGSALADRLARVGVEARDVAAATVLAAAERAGVRAVAPLGLCFLPAFVAVGIVPVVAASLGHVHW